MKVAVVVFPGTNCERETFRACELVGLEPKFVWHTQKNLDDFGAIILPGGFSYGDYLRAGALASHSPVMQEVVRQAEKGKAVIGICNGFQILCESKLLDGTLMLNDSTRFVCRFVDVIVEDNETPLTFGLEKGDRIKMPVAHKYGKFWSKRKPNIVFRYLENPNGSLWDTAGISNMKKNVVGLMPHPERAVEFISRDGLEMFRALKNWLKSN